MERPDGGVGRQRTAETEVGRRAWPFTQSGLSRTGGDLRRDGDDEAIIGIGNNRMSRKRSTRTTADGAKLVMKLIFLQALSTSLPLPHMGTLYKPCTPPPICFYQKMSPLRLRCILY